MAPPWRTAGKLIDEIMELNFNFKMNTKGVVRYRYGYVQFVVRIPIALLRFYDTIYSSNLSKSKCGALKFAWLL